MSPSASIREHEVAFCADIKSWAEALFAAHPEWPFSRAAIEQYGPTGRKRQDIRFYRRGNETAVISGEVKLPGTPEGQSPYQPDLMQDAFTKADSIQCLYYFTWNVNNFVCLPHRQCRNAGKDRRSIVTLVYSWPGID
jgi:hypothetical protein